MNITSERELMVFKSERNGNVYYSLGVSKKNQDNSYTNGYINCRFKKDVSLDNKTKIKIKKAWLDFYVKDNITYSYVFISEFEVKNDELKGIPEVKSEYKTTENSVEILESELPF